MTNSWRKALDFTMMRRDHQEDGGSSKSQDETKSSGEDTRKHPRVWQGQEGRTSQGEIKRDGEDTPGHPRVRQSQVGRTLLGIPGWDNVRWGRHSSVPYSKSLCIMNFSAVQNQTGDKWSSISKSPVVWACPAIDWHPVQAVASASWNKIRVTTNLFGKLHISLSQAL